MKSEKFRNCPKCNVICQRSYRLHPQGPWTVHDPLFKGFACVCCRIEF